MTRRPKFIPPLTALKKKVGDGGIPAYILKQAQDFMERNTVDFTSHARRFLDDLNSLKTDTETLEKQPKQAIAKIVDIVMQLKSNGSMFRYQLISMISDVMLRFLEKMEIVDNDFIEILEVYTKILTIILNKQLTGNGGREGYALTQELHNACERYYNKHDIR